MEIIKNREGNKLTVSLTGRLDTVSSPQLEEDLFASLDGVEELIFDLAQLDYTSSAGLRVFLKAQKKMNEQGSMCVINTCEDIKEIFEITGFAAIIEMK